MMENTHIYDLSSMHADRNCQTDKSSSVVTPHMELWEFLSHYI